MNLPHAERDSNDDVRNDRNVNDQEAAMTFRFSEAFRHELFLVHDAEYARRALAPRYP